MIITFDGPAGSGKSTVAKLVADRLGFQFLNTGAMYRAITLKILKYHISLDNKDALIDLLNNTKIEFKNNKIFLDDNDVSIDIKKPEIDQNVSKVSSIKLIRERLVHIQREVAKTGDFVLEGRDTGSVVFPDANYKFFITATPEERARRRYKEIIEKKISNVDYDTILKEIIRRDKEDSTREISPLIIPENAIIIDTSNMTIDEVVDKVISYIKR